MSERTDELLDEVVRLIVVGLRRGTENQADAIAMLTQAGFSSGRIGALLGTSEATVRTAQHRLKKGRSSGRG